MAWRRVDVAGLSMVPTLAPSERLLVRTGTPPRKGDVVVVRRDGRLVVKRIAAGPGERAGGRLLGAGEWWVEGDNPAASDDSRVFGPVPGDAIVGRVVFRYGPWRARGRIR